MTTAIHLCTEAEQERLAALVTRARTETDADVSLDGLADGLAPLTSGTPLGAAWLFGPLRAPTGYVILSFRHVPARGGTMAAVEEIFVRPTVRRRGIATEVLLALAPALRQGGVVALQMDLPGDAPGAANRLAARAGLIGTGPVTRHLRPLQSGPTRAISGP